MDQYQIYPSEDEGHYRWRLRDTGNNKNLASGQQYDSKSNVKRFLREQYGEDIEIVEVDE